jgi:hypothetical protein
MIKILVTKLSELDWKREFLRKVGLTPISDYTEEGKYWLTESIEDRLDYENNKDKEED